MIDGDGALDPGLRSSVILLGLEDVAGLVGILLVTYDVCLTLCELLECTDVAGELIHLLLQLCDCILSWNLINLTVGKFNAKICRRCIFIWSQRINHNTRQVEFCNTLKECVSILSCSLSERFVLPASATVPRDSPFTILVNLECRSLAIFSLDSDSGNRFSVLVLHFLPGCSVIRHFPVSIFIDSYGRCLAVIDVNIAAVLELEVISYDNLSC